MSLRIVEKSADASTADTIHAIAVKVEAIDFWAGAVDEKAKTPQTAAQPGKKYTLRWNSAPSFTTTAFCSSGYRQF